MLISTQITNSKNHLASADAKLFWANPLVHLLILKSSMASVPKFSLGELLQMRYEHGQKCFAVN